MLLYHTEFVQFFLKGSIYIGDTKNSCNGNAVRERTCANLVKIQKPLVAETTFIKSLVQILSRGICLFNNIVAK